MKRRRTRSSLASAGFAALVFGLPASAAAQTESVFLGGGMTDSLGRGLYSDASNWIPSVVPVNGAGQTFSVTVPTLARVLLDRTDPTEIDGFSLRDGARFDLAPGTQLETLGVLELDGVVGAQGGEFAALGSGAAAAFAAGTGRLFAEAGGDIRIAATEFSSAGLLDDFEILRAEGSGSVIDLSAATVFTGPQQNRGRVRVDNHSVLAIDGGVIDLSGVVSFNGANSGNRLLLRSDGGTIDLSSTPSLGPGDIRIQVLGGGLIDFGSLSTLSSLRILLEGEGSELRTGLVSSIENIVLEVNDGAEFGGNVAAGVLGVAGGTTDLDSRGGLILLPTIGEIVGATDVEGRAGAMIDLSGVTISDPLRAFASGGSSIDLSSLPKLGFGSEFIASGSDSSIDIALASSAAADVRLSVSDGASLHAPLIDDLGGVRVAFAGTDSSLQLAPQIVNIDASSLFLADGTSFGSQVTQTNYSALADNGSAMRVESGATLLLPMIESISGPTSGGGASRFQSIVATSGAWIDLSGVTSVAAPTLGEPDSGEIGFSASGGFIDLSSLHSLTGRVAFNADQGGELDASALNSIPVFTGSRISRISVAGGGTLRLSGIADLAGFSVDIAGDTSELITANEITNITGADIKVVDGARFGDGVSQTQLGTFTSPDGTSTRLEADGAGSEIVLPTITHLVRDASFGPGASDGGGLVLACDGGLIDLSSLEQIEGAIGPSRELRFEASDATIDLRSLGPIVDGSVAFETRENASLIAGSLVGDIELRISGGLLDVRGDIRPTNPARIVFLENTVKIGGDLEYAAGVSSRVTENTDIGFVGGTVQYLEVAGEDRGVVNPTAFDENFQFKTITVGDGTERSTLVLRDRIDHGNGGAQAEALYILRNPLSPDDPPVFDGQSLFIESGSTLRLNGISTYAVLDGEVAGQVYDNELVKLNDLVPPGQTSIAFGDGLLSTEGRCLGDATSDNTVGLNDLLIVLAAFGDSIENGAAGGDLDNSGKIDLDDLLEVLANFGASCL